MVPVSGMKMKEKEEEWVRK